MVLGTWIYGPATTQDVGGTDTHSNTQSMAAAGI